jgi:hypothetical protein
MQNKPLKENDDDMFGGGAPAKPGGRRARDKDLFGTPKRLVIAKVLRAHAQGCVKDIAKAQRRAQAGRANTWEDSDYLNSLQQLANLMTKVADVFQFKGTAPGWLAYHRALRKLNAEGVEEHLYFTQDEYDNLIIYYSTPNKGKVKLGFSNNIIYFKNNPNKKYKIVNIGENNVSFDLINPDGSTQEYRAIEH